MTLSEKATKLYNALKKGSMHEGDAIKVLFPEPKYIGTLDPGFTNEEKETVQKIYWQWEININGIANTRPILGISTLIEPTANYSSITFAAWKEIKDAGLGWSKNMGYNTYRYYVKF